MMAINGSHSRKSSSTSMPLFETKRARGTTAYRAFAATVFVGICLIWTYRASCVPPEEGRIRWAWFGMMASELWFGIYWILTQALRWSLVYRRPFKDRLSLRYEDELPSVDVYVCTADPSIEPPVMVINTVLSVMCYDYPTRKLSVYLSDDAGSNITYYAMLEASEFARSWIPFCKKYAVEPRSPAAYFRSSPSGAVHGDVNGEEELSAIKKLYEAMKSRIESAYDLGRVPEEVRSKHEEFSHWNSYVSRRDHDTILQILIDNTNPEASDVEGNVMPTLVYLAREKRPQHFHNFKAGAMNALIRVSSAISNAAPVILNVDCDMYSNNSGALREALCFFMDEEEGGRIAYVQCPQYYENITRNEIYGSSLKAILQVEFPGLDGQGGVLYIGSGCFHRRDILCGKKFAEDVQGEWRIGGKPTRNSIDNLDEVKRLADCSSEENTQWGKEMGLIYGCPVEDVITGLSIKCRGWRSVYYNPERWAFLGLAPVTLLQTLVQHKRWSEGDFQIFLSKYCPAWYGAGKIRPGLIMGYLSYLLWAPNCLATIFYALIPSLFLLKGQSLFPQPSSLWLVPYAYVAATNYGYSLLEFLRSDGTVLGWWNEQRMWLYKRTTSYLFATIDTLVKVLGFSETAFVVSPKVADADVSERYEKEIVEFGASSPMFTILTTIALTNVICLVGAFVKAGSIGMLGPSILQVVLCGALVLINLPLYQGIIRKDEGRMPFSTTSTSFVLAMTICLGFALLS